MCTTVDNSGGVSFDDLVTVALTGLTEERVESRIAFKKFGSKYKIVYKKVLKMRFRPFLCIKTWFLTLVFFYFFKSSSVHTHSTQTGA